MPKRKQEKPPAIFESDELPKRTGCRITTPRIRRLAKRWIRAGAQSVQSLKDREKAVKRHERAEQSYRILSRDLALAIDPLIRDQRATLRQLAKEFGTSHVTLSKLRTYLRVLERMNWRRGEALPGIDQAVAMSDLPDYGQKDFEKLTRQYIAAKTGPREISAYIKQEERLGDWNRSCEMQRAELEEQALDEKNSKWQREEAKINCSKLGRVTFRSVMMHEGGEIVCPSCASILKVEGAAKARKSKATGNPVTSPPSRSTESEIQQAVADVVAGPLPSLKTG